MLYIVFISFILFNYRIASKISNKNFDEFLITGFIIQAGSLILSGYLLSLVNYWHSAIAWSIIPFFVSYLIYLFFKNIVALPSLDHRSSFKLVGLSIQQIHEVYKQQRKSEKFLFACIFIGISVIAVTQLFLFFYLPPNEWDSMTGHLNRILYFNQNHTTAHFIGTNWNIDTYPKSFSSVQFYPFLMTGFNEHFFKLPNFSAYWMLFVGSYAILKQLKVDFKVRLLSSCLILFTPIILIQSTTTDTDIALAAYSVCGLYFLFRYLSSKQFYYIYLFTFSLSIALSHKITFVFMLPSIAILLLYVIHHNYLAIQYRHLKHFIFSFLFILLVSMPTGYLANILHYGHPIGPETATKHQSIERAGTLSNLVVHGSKNMARYFFDLLNFDGLRNISFIESGQEKVNSLFRYLDTHLNWGLESAKTFTIVPFNYTRQFDFYNGTPIYGSIFLFIFIPSIFFLLTRKRPLIFYLFLIGFLLHFSALAYTAAYDPWKGRYMISSIIFLIPISTLYFDRIVMANTYKRVIPIFVIVILSAWCTIAFHGRSALFSTKGIPTIWNKTRMQILTISRPDITRAYEKFDSIVPQNAIVALGTMNDDYEYPLWGEKFSRKLIPINPFEKGLQPIPQDAQYLFFSKRVIKPLPSDLRLGTDTTLREHIIVKGEDYYLRKLK